MRNIYLFSFISLIVLWISALYCVFTPQTGTIDETLVFIQGESGGTGSGVIVKSGINESWVMTAKHVCVAMGSKPTLTTSTKHKTNPTKIILSPTTDLCLIKIPLGLLPYSKLASDYKLGQRVTNTGCPMGVCYHKTSGYIGEKQTIQNLNLLQFSCSIYPGASGSGVFNDQDELLGIVSMVYIGHYTIGLMVPLDDIVVMMQSVKNN